MKLKDYVYEIYTEEFQSNGPSALWGEFLEVLEALSKRDLQNFLYELSQVVLYVLILSFYKLPILGEVNLPSWLPWEDDYRRIVKWNQILKMADAPNQVLDLHWFDQGNNWERPHKVPYVLEKAGKNVSLEEAQELIELVKE